MCRVRGERDIITTDTSAGYRHEQSTSESRAVRNASAARGLQDSTTMLAG